MSRHALVAEVEALDDPVDVVRVGDGRRVVGAHRHREAVEQVAEVGAGDLLGGGAGPEGALGRAGLRRRGATHVVHSVAPGHGREQHNRLLISAVAVRVHFPT